MIESFQKDLRKGMELEEALIKYNISLKDAVELCPKPYCHRGKTQKKRQRKNTYKKVGQFIHLKNDSYCVRKTIAGKNAWGGAYNTLEEAQKIRDFLEENGWNPLQVNKACKKFNIKRRRR